MSEITTRTRIEIHYDELADDPTVDDDGSPIIVSRRLDDRDATIHERMRGVSCAVRVDVPRSHVDRYAGEAIAYATPEHVREWYGEDTPETREKARDSLIAFAQEWRAWADGYTFGYTLTRERVCGECDQWEEVETDSLWGITTGDQDELADRIRGNLTEDGEIAALANAIETWTGEYPVAARGVHPVEVAAE